MIEASHPPGGCPSVAETWRVRAGNGSPLDGQGAVVGCGGAVLGGDPHDESPGVGEDPGGHGDQLAAPALAVGPSVGAGVDPGQALEPHRAVEGEEDRPHPGPVHRLEARGQMAQRYAGLESSMRSWTR